jgi:hypothetical protein
MKTITYMIVTIAICAGLLTTGFSAAQVEERVTFALTGNILQNQAGSYTYTISVSGSNYQMKNGVTKQVIFQSSNSSKVFSNVVGNCSVGSSINIEAGVYAINTMWLIKDASNITLSFNKDAKLVAANLLNTAVLVLFNSNNCVIDGVEIDGNAAGQTLDGGGFTWNGLYMETDGIFVSGNNDIIQNAIIYNCRTIGVAIATITRSPVNSGVINCLIYNCGWNGINVGGVGGLNCYALENEVYGCGDVGICCGGDNSLVQGNYVHDIDGTIGDGNTHSGILAEAGDYSLMTLNTVQNCKIGMGIAGETASPANYITASYNEITNCFTGIALDGRASGSCVGNIVAYNNISSMKPVDVFHTHVEYQ